MKEIKAGQKYIVGCDCSEHGNVIQITEIEGHHCYYKTIKGESPKNGFSIGSIFAESLVPYEEKIIITTDGKTTTARLYEGGKTLIKTAEAKCNPADTFDFNIGAKLAIERLLTEEKPKETTEENPKRVERFEKGKRYVFDYKTFIAVEYDSTQHKGWTKECDGKEVKVTCDFDGTIGGFYISPQWCKEIPAFNVGDRVRIREWKDMKREFGCNHNGSINVPFGFNDRMKHLCGRSATITDISEVFGVEVDFDDKSGDTSWSYSPEMLELITEPAFDWEAFKRGEINVKVTEEEFEDFRAAAKKNGCTFKPDEYFEFFNADGRAFRALMQSITPVPFDCAENEIFVNYEHNALKVGWHLNGKKVVLW